MMAIWCIAQLTWTTSAFSQSNQPVPVADQYQADVDWQDPESVDRFVAMQQPEPAAPPAPPRPTPRSTQGLGLTVGGGASTSLVAAPLAAAPYMIGDFFGGATSGSGATITIFDGTIAGQPSGLSLPLGPDPIVGQVIFQEVVVGNVVSNPTTVDTVDVINQALINGTATTFALQQDPLLTQAIQDSLNVGDDEFVVTQASSDAEFLAGAGTPIVTSQSRFNLASTYDVFQVFRINVPNPGDGGTVGRMKIAENGSPIPRDRVFFNYSYFDNVPLTQTGVNVHRFSPGFEKTFLNQMASIEVRVPFASTLDNDIIADGITNTGQGEFGNLFITLKGLLMSNETSALSAGLSITAPTADDVSVQTAAGNELVHIRNESVHIMPFLGALYTPSDRFFTQGFLQIDADANGCPVDADLTGAGLQRIGRIDSATYLYADVGVGYWLYRSCCPSCCVTGFAPTMELHYNRSLETNDVVQAGTFQIGNTADNVEVMNLVVGATTEFGRNKYLTIGYANPIAGGNDRQFDGELRIFMNWLFGPTNRRTRTFF